mmetsp:Transcript_17347/g.43290  ORF Transcript_17347/g.43290 Transcript_17347/m.43290 type:complete len:244 (-) Transcript_17347:515-1246(-)
MGKSLGLSDFVSPQPRHLSPQKGPQGNCQFGHCHCHQGPGTRVFSLSGRRGRPGCFQARVKVVECRRIGFANFLLCLSQQRHVGTRHGSNLLLSNDTGRRPTTRVDWNGLGFQCLRWSRRGMLLAVRRRSQDCGRGVHQPCSFSLHQIEPQGSHYSRGWILSHGRGGNFVGDGGVSLESKSQPAFISGGYRRYFNCQSWHSKGAVAHAWVGCRRGHERARGQLLLFCKPWARDSGVDRCGPTQ